MSILKKIGKMFTENPSSSPKKVSDFAPAMDHQLLMQQKMIEEANRLIMSENFINLIEKITIIIDQEKNINNKILDTPDPKDSFRVVTTRLKLAGDTKDKEFEEFYDFLDKVLLTIDKKNEKGEWIKFPIKFVSLGDPFFYRKVLPELKEEEKETLKENLLTALKKIKHLAQSHLQKEELNHSIQACLTSNAHAKQSLIESSVLSSALITTVSSLVDSNYSNNPKVPSKEDHLTVKSETDLVINVKNNGDSLAKVNRRDHKEGQVKLSHQEILDLISTKFNLTPCQEKSLKINENAIENSATKDSLTEVKLGSYSQDLANIEVFKLSNEQDFKENPLYTPPVRQSPLAFFKQENNQSSMPPQGEIYSNPSQHNVLKKIQNRFFEEIKQTVSSNANPLTAIFSRSVLL